MIDDDLIRRGDAKALCDKYTYVEGVKYWLDDVPAAPLDALALELAAQVAEANAPKECDRDDVSLGASAAAHGIARAIRALAPEPAEVTAARVLLDAQLAAMAKAGSSMTEMEVILANIDTRQLRALLVARHD